MLGAEWLLRIKYRSQNSEKSDFWTKFRPLFRPKYTKRSEFRLVRAKSDQNRSPGVDTMKLKDTILNDNHEYEQKLELGKAITEIINNYEVYLNSLRPEYKEALDLYTLTTS